MNKQNVNQKIRPNVENLPFSEYYNALKDEPKSSPNYPLTPLDEFLIVVGEKLGKHPGTIRRWAYGTAKANLLEKQALAKLLKCDVECLFPVEL